MSLVCHHSSGSATTVEVNRESSSSSESTPSAVTVKEESRPAHITHHTDGITRPGPAREPAICSPHATHRLDPRNARRSADLSHPSRCSLSEQIE